jgi:hypothetical protein
MMVRQPIKPYTLKDWELFEYYPDLLGLVRRRPCEYFKSRTHEVPELRTAYRHWAWIAATLGAATTTKKPESSAQQLIISDTAFSWRFIHCCNGRERWDEESKAIYMCFKLGVLTFRPLGGHFHVSATKFFQDELLDAVDSLVLRGGDACLRDTVVLATNCFIERPRLMSYSRVPGRPLTCLLGELINCFIRADCTSERFAPGIGVALDEIPTTLQFELVARLIDSTPGESELARKATFWMSYGRLTYSAVQRRFIMLPLHVWMVAELIDEQFCAPMLYLDHVDLILHTSMQATDVSRAGALAVIQASRLPGVPQYMTVLGILNAAAIAILRREVPDLSASEIAAITDARADGRRLPFNRQLAWADHLVEELFQHASALVGAAVGGLVDANSLGQRAKILLPDQFILSIVVRIVRSVTYGAAHMPSSMYRRQMMALHDIIRARPMNPWALKAWAYFY